MKKIQKTIYVAEDDAKFETEKECRLHEELLWIAKQIESHDNYHDAHGAHLEGSSYEIAILFRFLMDSILEKRENEGVVALEKL